MQRHKKALLQKTFLFYTIVNLYAIFSPTQAATPAGTGYTGKKWTPVQTQTAASDPNLPAIEHALQSISTQADQMIGFTSLIDPLLKQLKNTLTTGTSLGGGSGPATTAAISQQVLTKLRLINEKLARALETVKTSLRMLPDGSLKEQFKAQQAKVAQQEASYTNFRSF